MKKLEEYGLSSWDNIVIKIGSNILAWDNDWVNIKNMQNIVNGIAYLMSLWLNIFLVSSWAVAVWKKNFEKNNILFWDKITQDEKAFLSWNGQIDLIYFYKKLFEKKKILVAQNLLTHNNFRNKNILNNLQNVWMQNVKYRTLAIINENDTISREELKFSDNDELAWLVALNVKAKILILMSDIDWVYKNFWTENQEIIKQVNNIDNVRNYCVESNWTCVWTWWMNSKLNVMEKMIDNDIIWILINWWDKDILQNIFWKKTFTNTFFWKKDYNKTIFRKTWLTK